MAAQSRNQRAHDTPQKVSSAKTPRSNPVSTSGKTVVSTAPSIDDRLSWRIAWLSPQQTDRWGRESMSLRDAVLFHSFLVDMEGHTWRDAGRGTGNRARLKSIPVADISRDAQRELARRKIDDVEDLWELHQNGETRLWGIRIGSVFCLLWWDREHEVCPSPKRGT